VSGFLSGLVQEHERGLGGWQLEWSAVSDTVQATGAALAGIAATFEHLQVFPDRMRANLEATHGVVFAERAMLLLRAKVGREKAEAIVNTAIAETGPSRTFAAALRSNAEAIAALGEQEIDALSTPGVYVSAAETVRRELLRRS
jgi:3-carboxy-cis,cis-muconate cycloisomerase